MTGAQIGAEFRPFKMDRRQDEWEDASESDLETIKAMKERLGGK